ncbi:MAG TPA: hypothetical protein VK669_04935 [Candidatus Limnocylindrales bacterium]|nr:hypothetical protein [Candidatus Limnocylindrales bacterium]
MSVALSSLLRVIHVPEPSLQFGMGQKLEYPRDGLFLYGPVTNAADLPTVRYGAIGTADGVRRLCDWTRSVARFVDVPAPGPRSREIEPQHVPFPGFSAAFGAQWPATPVHMIDDIDPKDIHRCLRIENRYEAVHATVDLYVTRLVAANNRIENPPAFWFVVVPDEVYELGRPLSRVKKAERLAGSITISRGRARSLTAAPTLFEEENQQAEIYRYANHFRRQLKARLLGEKIITQIARETTLTPAEFVRSDGRPSRPIQDPATVAWNMCTAAYYKAGGRPWHLADVRPGVCYVGLVYKQVNDLMSDRTHAVCAAQMFLTDGDGIVFRGALGPWYDVDSRQYHLDAAAAHNLVALVVSEYAREHGAPPGELFIHARSSFTDEEWRGFLSAVPAETKLVGVQIVRGSGLKLFREGDYPVIRGTAVKTDDRGAYLWASGYVPRLDTYMGPETPNPLWIRVIRGDCPIEVVLSDILGLTKINFNSCVFNDGEPVTIRFADAVGDVLVAAPTDGEPRLPFKHYI